MKNFLALAFLMSCTVCGNAASLPSTAPVRKHCSQPLDNAASWSDLRAVALRAQEQDKNHSTRIIPKMTEKKFKEIESCCLSANILNYYLENVLTGVEHHDHHRLPAVINTLHVVRKDLVDNASCSLHEYKTHHYVTKFKKNIEAAGPDNRTKAISELDILFLYIYESCGQDRC